MLGHPDPKFWGEVDRRFMLFVRNLCLVSGIVALSLGNTAKAPNMNPGFYDITKRQQLILGFDCQRFCRSKEFELF